ncbi:MAG: TetR/AcrR family transcriptional regulator [Bacteriovoracaceae bacterium]
MGITERKEREKESRKESIIDAAQKVFFEKGLNLSTMDEIAETAELAKGTLYLYYHSKEDLYLDVMMRGLKILRTMFKTVIDHKLPVVQTLVMLADTYTAFYETNKNYFRMMHFFNTPQFHKQVSEEMMQSCDRFNQSLWTMITEIIERGMTEKKLRADLNPLEIAIIMWSNASTLLMRIDNQHEMFMKKMNIDLNNTLRMSNMLLLESVMTEHGKQELRTV